GAPRRWRAGAPLLHAQSLDGDAGDLPEPRPRSERLRCILSASAVPSAATHAPTTNATFAPNLGCVARPRRPAMPRAPATAVLIVMVADAPPSSLSSAREVTMVAVATCAAPRPVPEKTSEVKRRGSEPPGS